MKRNSSKNKRLIVTLIAVGGLVIGFCWFSRNTLFQFMASISQSETSSSVGDELSMVNKNDFTIYRNVDWGIEFQLPAYLLIQDTEDGYPTCHGDGIEKETASAPWLCGLKIYDPSHPENKEFMRAPFLTMFAAFDPAVNVLPARAGEDSPVVEIEEVTFHSYPARKAIVYKDTTHEQVSSILYDVLVSEGYVLTVESFLYNTNLSVNDIEQILATLKVQPEVNKATWLVQ